MINKILGVLILIPLLATTTQAIELTKDFNFEGYLVDSSDAPLTGPANLVFQIYNPGGDCLLFQETQSSVALAADGFFSTKVGTGARASGSIDGGLLWKSIFQNDAQLRASSSPGCTAGYTPAAYDGRLLRVTVNGTVLTPDLAMSSVPMATVAETLQGKSPADFVSTAGGSTIAGPLRFSNQNELRFSDNSSNYVSLRAPTGLAGIITLTLPLNTGTAGQVLTTDGTGNLSWVAQSGGAGGTVTSVTTGMGLLGGPITTSGSLSVDVGTTSGKIVQLDGSARLPAVDGSLLTNVNAGSFSGTLSITSGGTGATAVAGARTNLGLGTSAVYDIGSAAFQMVQLDGLGKLPSLDGSQLFNVNASSVSSGIIPIANGGTGAAAVGSARTNLGLAIGTDVQAWSSRLDNISGLNPTVDNFIVGNGSSFSVYTPSQAQTSLGLGTAATYNVGLAANNVVQLNGSGYLPSVNGSLLTNISASSVSGIIPLASGGTGASTIGGAKTNLGFVSMSGDTMTGYLTLNADPSTGLQAATKQYVDAMDGMHVNKAGDTMSGALAIAPAGSAAAPALAINSGGAGLFGAAGVLGFSVAGTEKFRVDSSGNVGIGTTTPTAKLHVVGGMSMFNGIRIDGTDVNTIWQSSASPLNITANGGDIGLGQTGTPQVTIKPNGSVGIGTPTPAGGPNSLDVSGSVKIGGSGTPILNMTHFNSVGCPTYSPGGTIAANAAAYCTISAVTGIAVGDTVICQPVTAPAFAVIHSCYVSAANVITVGVHNVGASLLSTPPTTWNVTVIKF